MEAVLAVLGLDEPQVKSVVGRARGRTVIAVLVHTKDGRMLRALRMGDGSWRRV